MTYDEVFNRWRAKGYCPNEARFRADAWEKRRDAKQPPTKEAGA